MCGKVEPLQINGVAYTVGPGLAGALLVGASLGRSLAWAWNVLSLEEGSELRDVADSAHELETALESRLRDQAWHIPGEMQYGNEEEISENDLRRALDRVVRAQLKIISAMGDGCSIPL